MKSQRLTVKDWLATAERRPSTGMTTASWRSIAPSLVALDDLTPTQRAVYGWAVKAARAGVMSWCGDGYPHAVRAGRLYLIDGHHRVAAAIEDGKTEILARVKETEDG